MVATQKLETPAAPLLSSTEIVLLRLLCVRASDASIRAALSCTQDEALAVTAEVRRKLCVQPGETIRERARALGMAKAVRS